MVLRVSFCWRVVFLLICIIPNKNLISSNSVLEGNFKITGDLLTEGMFTSSGDALLQKSLEVQGTTTFRGDLLVLQESGGTDVPMIAFKESDAEGGFTRGYIKPIASPGAKGVYFSVDGEQYNLGVAENGDINANGKMFVSDKAAFYEDVNVDGDLKHGCKNRGYMMLSNAITYSLGSEIHFDYEQDPDNHIWDDGQGSSFGIYEVAESGFYLITLHIAGDSIQLVKSPTGTPIAYLEVTHSYGSGPLSYLNSYMPLLSFGNEFHHTLTGILQANGGCLIAAKFYLFAITENGYEPLEGTVNLKSGPSGSHMAVHYLSSF